MRRTTTLLLALLGSIIAAPTFARQSGYIDRDDEFPAPPPAVPEYRTDVRIGRVTDLVPRGFYPSLLDQYPHGSDLLLGPNRPYNPYSADGGALPAPTLDVSTACELRSLSYVFLCPAGWMFAECDRGCVLASPDLRMAVATYQSWGLIRERLSMDDFVVRQVRELTTLENLRIVKSVVTAKDLNGVSGWVRFTYTSNGRQFEGLAKVRMHQQDGGVSGGILVAFCEQGLSGQFGAELKKLAEGIRADSGYR